MSSMIRYTKEQKEQERQLFENMKTVLAEKGLKTSYKEVAEVLTARGKRNVWGKIITQDYVSRVMLKNGIRKQSRRGINGNLPKVKRTLFLEKEDVNNKFSIAVSDVIIQVQEIVNMTVLNDYQKYSMLKTAINNSDIDFSKEIE